MGKLFGTDGVRGVAGKDLTCELALQIGRATAAELTSLDGHRPRILIGKDTRVSGDMLECTLAAGLCSVGADVDLLGVIPTPGVAYLVRKYGADAGIVISASHNPMEFNGIKIFKGDGYKLPDEVENRIEAHIFKNCEDIKICDGAEIGRVHRLDTAVDDYVDALEQHIDADLSGLNVLFDCANGASAKVAQKLFPRLGCQCSFTGTLDDGFYLSRISRNMTFEYAKIPEELKRLLELDGLVVTPPKMQVRFNSVGEFDYTREAGWMYCVNGAYPGRGMSEYFLSDGDTLTLRFTLAKGKDIGGSTGGNTGALQKYCGTWIDGRYIPNHTYKDGVCAVCGAVDPNHQHTETETVTKLSLIHI